jgi:hypothetical protein
MLKLALLYPLAKEWSKLILFFALTFSVVDGVYLFFDVLSASIGRFTMTSRSLKTPLSWLTISFTLECYWLFAG